MGECKTITIWRGVRGENDFKIIWSVNQQTARSGRVLKEGILDRYSSSDPSNCVDQIATGAVIELLRKRLCYGINLRFA